MPREAIDLLDLNIDLLLPEYKRPRHRQDKPMSVAEQRAQDQNQRARELIMALLGEYARLRRGELGVRQNVDLIAKLRSDKQELEDGRTRLEGLLSRLIPAVFRAGGLLAIGSGGKLGERVTVGWEGHVPNVTAVVRALAVEIGRDPRRMTVGSHLTVPTEGEPWVIAALIARYEGASKPVPDQMNDLVESGSLRLTVDVCDSCAHCQSFCREYAEAGSPARRLEAASRRASCTSPEADREAMRLNIY